MAPRLIISDAFGIFARELVPKQTTTGSIPPLYLPPALQKRQIKKMKKITNPFLDLIGKGYNCFACAPNNPYGLKMEFYEDGDDIVSFWTPGDNYQGWLNTLHGGIQATLLDESAGWLITHKFQTSGMTTNLNVKYKKPIPTGADVTLEIRARVKQTRRNFVYIDASISHNGEICSVGELTFFCFPKEVAEKEFHFSGSKT